MDQIQTLIKLSKNMKRLASLSNDTLWDIVNVYYSKVIIKLSTLSNINIPKRCLYAT